jgi:hypothetical protein
MPTRRKREDHSWELPRVPRAAIYLCEFGTYEPDLLRNAPSIDQQRGLCRCAAAVLHAEVVGEFVDQQRFR